jgi:hypothetical protein
MESDDSFFFNAASTASLFAVALFGANSQANAVVVVVTSAKTVLLRPLNEAVPSKVLCFFALEPESASPPRACQVRDLGRDARIVFLRMRERADPVP